MNVFPTATWIPWLVVRPQAALSSGRPVATYISLLRPRMLNRSPVLPLLTAMAMAVELRLTPSVSPEKLLFNLQESTPSVRPPGSRLPMAMLKLLRRMNARALVPIPPSYVALLVAVVRFRLVSYIPLGPGPCMQIGGLPAGRDLPPYPLEVPPASPSRLVVVRVPGARPMHLLTHSPIPWLPALNVAPARNDCPVAVAAARPVALIATLNRLAMLVLLIHIPIRLPRP